MTTALRRFRSPVWWAVGLLAAVTATFRWAGLSEFSLTVFSDVCQITASGFGAFCCLWRARRIPDERSRSWTLIGIGLACWFAGQLDWSYLEIIARTSPFPSTPDIGFLLLPPLALAGILLRPSGAFRRSLGLIVALDGLMVAASLFNLSWETSLGATYASKDPHLFGLVVSLAYPISDLVLLSVSLLVLIRARRRAGLIALSTGLIGLAVSDSAFVYLTAAGSYRSGSLADVGWLSAFALIGIAALLDRAPAEPARLSSRPTGLGYLALPYLLVAVGIAAFIHHDVARQPGGGERWVTAVVACVALVCLLARQALMMVENRRLVADVAARQDELQHRAFHDPLTGLANRALFADTVTTALEERDGRPLALIFCDLDDFKIVNDTLGHGAGDVMLVAAADRLRRVVRADDLVARLGGDEFGVVMRDTDDLGVLMDRLLAALTEPVTIAGRDVPCRASVGVAVVNDGEHVANADELLKRADIAMYAAKRAGKSRTVIYTSDLGERRDDDLDFRLALTAAVASGEIRTAFQPIFDAQGRLHAYEALARWDYQGRPVPPPVFIDAAERAGLLAEVDFAVMCSAIRRAGEIGSHPGAPRMTVNIGLSHLPDPCLVPRLAALLADAGVDASRLVVEIPEDRAIDNPAVLSALVRLRDLGVLLAIDDFGVGYSSLSRITDLNPDIVKLDRSFVNRLDENPNAGELTAGIVDLAHRLGVYVVAEGVETPEQLRLLRSAGCDAVQGFLLGRPSEETLTPR